MTDAELDRQLNRNPIENLEEDVAKLEEKYKTSKSQEDKTALVKTMYQLALMYQEVGEDKKAQEIYDKAVKIDPNEKRIIDFMRDMTPK